MPSAQCPVSPWDQARHSAAKLVRIVLSSWTIHASDSNPYDWGSWQIKSRSNQLPLSAFAKENHFPTAVTVCHRQTFNQNMNENAVNLANYSVDFWQKRPSYFIIQTWSNQQWLLVDTDHCFPIPNGSQAILLETSNDSLPRRAQGEHIRLRENTRNIKKQHKQRRLKESAAAILKYLKNMFQKLSHAS